MEEFASDVARAGLNLDYCQLAPDLAPSGMQLTASEHVNIARFQVGSRIHHRIDSPEGMSTFGILAGSQRPSVIQAREFACGDMLQAHPQEGLDAVINPGFDGFVLNFSTLRLQELADQHGIQQPGQAGSERQIDPFFYRATRKTLADIQQLALSDPASFELLDLIENELPRIVLESWAGAPGAVQRDRGTRLRACARAVDLIRSREREALSVQQLCDGAASSYSTLERGFRELYGVSPKQYMLRSRLAGVRRDLLGSGDDRSITELAYHWGFTHMGKFAADYNGFFGELPSRTRALR